MSRIFEALQRLDRDITIAVPTESAEGAESAIAVESTPLDSAPHFTFQSEPESRLVSLHDTRSLAAEKIRELAARLRLAQQKESFNRVLVTSTVRGEGKTLVSLNLAIALAQQGHKTLIVDGDFYRSGLKLLIHGKPNAGLCEWWTRKDAIANHLSRAEKLPLWLLPAGTLHHSSQNMLQSPAMAELLDELSQNFEWVVIDCPPMMPVVDANIWMSLVDAVVMIVRERVTPKGPLTKVVKGIDPAKLFSVVMNDASAAETKYYSDYYR